MSHVDRAGLLARLTGGYRPKPGRPAGPVDRPVGRYGPQRQQRGQWWLPAGRSDLPLVVLVHGGYWRRGFDHHLQDAVAAALVDRGFAVWNIDYRSSAQPWPATLSDAAAALDHVASCPRVDLSRVAVVGHSAGGQLALWLASRDRLPADVVGATPVVRPVLVVAQAPVADLVAGALERLGRGAVQALLGGDPDQVPERYAIASPLALLPLSGGRVVLVHGDADNTVPLRQSQGYAEASGAELHVLPGLGHFEHLDPASPALTPVVAALARL